jgi:hypothetical protein
MIIAYLPRAATEIVDGGCKSFQSPARNAGRERRIAVWVPRGAAFGQHLDEKILGTPV